MAAPSTPLAAAASCEATDLLARFPEAALDTQPEEDADVPSAQGQPVTPAETHAMEQYAVALCKHV